MKKRRKPTEEPLLERARELRQLHTYAEKYAWGMLRDRRMMGLKFRRQFPIASYIADFYCEELKLVLELDGGVHNDPQQAIHDDIRDIHLCELGYRVLRVPNEMVLSAPGEFVAAIRRFVTDSKTNRGSTR